MRKHWRFGIIVLSLSCAFTLAVEASPPTQPAEPRNLQTEYIVSNWSQSDGLPAGFVRALAQDVEGYIWVGTDAGLYRFDGHHFVAVQFTAGNGITFAAQVRMLFAAHDGGLWVALGDGKIVRYKGGRTQYVGEAPTQPRTTISAMVEDSAGALWVGGTAGLFKHLPNSSTSWIETSIRSPVFDARFDHAGQLLVVTADAILRGRPDDGEFEIVTKGPTNIRDIAEASDGTLYGTDPAFGFRRVGAGGEPLSTEPTRGFHLIADRQGDLWLGTGGQGLWRWSKDHSGRFLAARITATTGLLAGGVVALMEDREGDIWAGTPAGLSRLTRRKVQLIPNLLLIAGAEQTSDSSLWVGTGEELLRFDGDTASAPSERWATGSPVRALHGDRQGTLWLATEQYLAQVVGGQIVRAATSGDFPRRIDNITSLSSNDLIVYDLDRGLLRWRLGRFERIALPLNLENQPVVASYTDSSSRAWFAFDDGRLAALSELGNLVVYDAADASGGRYHAIVDDGHGAVWFAGVRGLTRYENGTFATIHREQGFFATTLTAMVPDTAGDIWFGSNSGITRVEKAELVAALADPSYQPKVITYDRSDGLTGLPVPYSRNRRAVRGHSGKLWFLTGQGITVVDPATMVRSAPPQSVYVETLTADGTRFDTGDKLSLPPRTRRVDFEFSALNVTFGSKTQFRYKLDPFDSAWVPAGARRQVTYTNLSPGRYRFLVSASDGDGQWIEAHAPWDFTIKPAFYETAWFMASLFSMMVVVLWGSWRLHSRRVRREFSLLLRERTRVSREIHDRLLQNLVALTLEFDEASTVIDASWPRAQLIRWRKLVEQYILEARQSIWDLRSPVQEERGFTALLKQNCERSASGKGTDYLKFSVTGQPRDCSANAEEQVLRIAQEAVLNASRHARANVVSVQLGFEADHLCLTVADDGAGFDMALQADENGDHYGLRMMKERAENMGGMFRITSTCGEGTTVLVRVPAPVQEAVS